MDEEGLYSLQSDEEKRSYLLTLISNKGIESVRDTIISILPEKFREKSDNEAIYWYAVEKEVAKMFCYWSLSLSGQSFEDNLPYRDFISRSIISFFKEKYLLELDDLKEYMEATGTHSIYLLLGKGINRALELDDPSIILQITSIESEFLKIFFKTFKDALDFSFD